MNPLNTLKKITALLAMLCCFTEIHAQSFSWAKSGAQQGYAVVTDNSHNVIVVGTYNTVGIVGTTLPFWGMNDGFVAKYSSTGTLMWAKGFGGYQNDYAKSVTADASGNIYVAGYYASPDGIHFTASDSLTQSGSVSLFLAKYDPSGNFLWAKKGTISGTQYSDVPALAIDPSGNIIMGGSYSNSLTFGSTTISGGVINLFVGKFTNTGSEVWLKSGTAASLCQFNALTTDASGNIYGTGKIPGTIDWGTGPLTSPVGDQAFVMKFNSSGTMQWLNREGNTSSGMTSTNDYHCGNGICVDNTGNIYIGGSLLDTSYLDMTTMSIVARQWGMIAKYSNSGVKQWLKHIGGGNKYNNVYSMAIDAVGNPYVIGSYKDTMSISGTALPPASSPDIFIARLTPSGNVTWFKTAGGANRDFGGDIAIDVDGSVVSTGYFESGAAFDAFTLTGMWLTDAFVTRQSNIVALGVTNTYEASDISVFPNPVENDLNINNETGDICTVCISNIIGQVVIKQVVATGITKIDVSYLSPGIYSLILNGDSLRRFSKFVKQ